MRTMLKLLVLILAASLNGCRSTSLTLTTEQCSPFIALTETGEVDLPGSRCFCRQYTFDREFLGPEPGTQTDHPLAYCNKVMGFTNYSDVATFWEKVRREINANP